MGFYVFDNMWAQLGNISYRENVSQESDGNYSRGIVPSTLHPVTDIFIGLYMALSMVLSCLLNLLVIVTMCRRKRQLASLEYYVLFLSALDILQALAGFPLVILSSFKHGWFWGDALCQYEAAVVFFSGCASITTLATMSVMRYIKTCHAQQGLLITTKVVFATLVLVCLLSAVWSLSPVLGWGRYEPEPYALSCSLAWNDLEPVYTWSIFSWCFGLPILLMFYCYTRMVLSVYKAQKNMKTTKNRMDIYLTKMAFCMCLCFLVAWTPYAVVSLMYVTGRADYVPLALVAGAPLFAKTSTWYNPLVYFLSVKRFRQDAREFALCCCKPKDAALETNTIDTAELDASSPMQNKQKLFGTATPSSGDRTYRQVPREENHNDKKCDTKAKSRLEMTYIVIKTDSEEEP